MSFTLSLAPIQGITDHLYRNVFFRFFHGFDLAVAPFIPTRKGSRIHNKTLRGLLPENNSGMPLIPQILGNDPDEFIAIAVKLYALGYGTVNWNLGCPYPMVANKQRGSGLLPFPDKIKSFLDRVMSRLPGGLSVKTRLGRFHADELFKLMDIFHAFPLELIIVHPRTGILMYDGTPDLDAFEQILSLSVHPVAYNGDITTVHKFTELTRRFPGVSHWMIGRGALADPFLPADIRGITSFSGINRLEIIRQFTAELYQTYQQAFHGPAHPLDRMKGIWKYLAESLHEGKDILKKIQRSHSPKQYETVLERFFSEQAHWVGAQKMNAKHY